MVSDDPGGGRIDGDQLVLLVDGDEDVSRVGVVDGVAGAAVERDGGDKCVGGGVDDGVGVAMLIGDEDALGAGA